jgi:hypothetical protein
MKILFLTTANLSTNPRLLKEINLCRKNSIDFEIIAFRLGNWYDENDQEVIRHFHQKVHYISATRNPFLPWFISSLVGYIAGLLFHLFRQHLLLAALASNKRTFLLLQRLKYQKYNYDLIIAHNLGALYPAFSFSQKHDIPFIFDVEDYHPGEICSPIEKYRRLLLFNKLLSLASYIYAASPLILKTSLEQIKNKPPHEVVDNVFSKEEFIFSNNPPDDKIQLVWFSQNINFGRGLELIIPVVRDLQSDFHINLIGKLSQGFYYKYLVNYKDCFTIKPPVSQKQLNQSLACYDVGVAFELSSADYNRTLCLTNKIWAYFQAGLYILATDTPAQVNFMNRFPTHGSIYSQNIDAIKSGLSEVASQITLIRENKRKRFQNALLHAWESQEDKVLKIWQSVL